MRDSWMIFRFREIQMPQKTEDRQSGKDVVSFFNFIDSQQNRIENALKERISRAKQNRVLLFFSNIQSAAKAIKELKPKRISAVALKLSPRCQVKICSWKSKS